MSSLETIGQQRVPGPDELLAALQDAGGIIRVVNPRTPVRARLRRSLHSLINSDLVPDGRRVRHTGRDRGDLVISLVSTQDAPRQPPPLPPLPVPTDLRKAHPAIRAIRDVKRGRGSWVDTRGMEDALHVSLHYSNLRRALLLIQALIGEAEHRGFAVMTAKGWDCPGGLRIGINGHSYELVVKEPQRRVPHEPTAEELARQRQYDWMRLPPWDYVPSGRLEIRSGHDQYHSPLAADRERWRLEDRLAHVLAKLEGKAAADEEKRLEKERKAEERLREWERVRARAIKRFGEQFRVKWLVEQLERATRARRIEEYLLVARTRHEPSTDELSWLEWVEGYARALHPATAEITPPQLPEPAPEDLAPYMEGWRADKPVPPWRLLQM